MSKATQRERLREDLCEANRAMHGGVLRCEYCHRPLGASYHVDHKVAVVLGGTNEVSNLAIACRSCNIGKSAMPWDYWMRYCVGAGWGVPIPPPLAGWGAPIPPPFVAKAQTTGSQDGKPAAALRAVGTWVNANSHRFADEQPHAERLGIHTSEGLAIVPEALRTYLEGLGYRPSAIRRAWMERDWVSHDAGRPDKKVTVDRSTRPFGRARMVVITYDALREIGGVKLAPEAQAW